MVWERLHINGGNCEKTENDDIFHRSLIRYRFKWYYGESGMAPLKMTVI